MSLSAELSCLQSSQGAEREAAFASLEKQLMCPICLEIFNKPVVILPCQHNLCRKCANELYQPSLFQARTTMMVNSGRFRCPSCRHEVVLDRHGVYGLQRNLLVENIIDVYKQELSSALSPLPPPPPPATQTPTCSDHEGEKVNIYCVTCQVPTCSLCKVFGAHQSCQVAPLTDVYQHQKDKLSEGVSSLVAFSDRIQAIIDELEESCRNIEENCKTQKQGVCDQFSHLFSILEDRQQAMKQRISYEQEEKTNHAQLLALSYGDSIEANNKLMESTLSSMEEPDMAAFIQISGELITKVMAATTSCPSQTLTPGYENLSSYRVNFNEQQTALQSIDFVKVVEDVPEEPVEADPEDPREQESEKHQESPSEDLEALVEAVKRPEPELISPPVAPVQPPEQESPSIPPAPVPVADSVEAEEEPMPLEADEPDLFVVAPARVQVERTGEGGEAQKEVEAPHPVLEENICEDQEGLSTQQAVTLLFYLVAILVILQRVWSYIGCFICT